MQFKTAVVIGVVAKHVQVHNPNDVVHFSREVIHVGFAAQQALFLTSEENYLYGPVEFVKTEQPRGFHQGGNATGIVFRAWRVCGGRTGGAVHVGGH